MKRFIQKTTSVFLSLLMVALIGAPAYATAAEDETVYEVSPEIVESVLSDIAGEKENITVTPVREAADEANIPPVCDHSDEENYIPDEPETETEQETEEKEPETEIEQETEEKEPEENDADEAPEDSVTDEVLDYIGSDEFQDAMEDAGIDSGEIEEEIEDGNYEIIYITQEEFEEMRKNYALSHISYSFTLLGESLLVLLMIPAVPFIFFLPFAGPFAAGAIIASPIIVLNALAYAIASPVIAYFEYKNYELDPHYEIVEETEDFC